MRIAIGAKAVMRAGLVASLMMGAAQAADSFKAEEKDAGGDTQWSSYNGTVDGQRYSPLKQITAENASRLGEVCRVQVEDVGSFHTGLVEVDGVIYLTTALDTLAIDASDCEIKWRHHYEPEQEPVWMVNRGVAYANGKVFRGTPDARLLALDAQTGKVVWQHQAGDPLQAEFFSAAPQVYQGLVIIGASGGDWGIRGRVMAYDIDDGREVWRFNTIPRGDEPGAKSWKNAGTARHGGGGTWTTTTLDMAAGEVYVPVGNPAPDFIPTLRPGENLYANSLVVLDARTGQLRWHHQLISNDGQDLDLGAAPMLYFSSKGAPMVVFGSKDGYVYGINRETHQRVFKQPITTIKNHGVAPTPEGVEVCPGALGGVEWNGPAMDRLNQAIVVGTVDWCAILKRDPNYVFKPGQINLGGTWTFEKPGKGWIVALDPDTGEIRWKYETAGPQVAGVTPTAGGVVFSGDMAGNFLVLESKTGRELFKSQTGGGMAGGVITYMRKGKQFVAAASGNVSRLTFGTAGSPSLVIYALDAEGKAQKAPKKPATVSAASPGDAERGHKTYDKVCAACHGAKGEGGVGPSLEKLSKRLDAGMTAAWIKNPSSKMPRLYPSPLDEQAVADVAAYVQGF
jgi:alcohol dehydrogenase (cytochrome c)